MLMERLGEPRGAPRPLLPPRRRLAEILVGRATNRQTITYLGLSQLTYGKPAPGVLDKILEHVAFYCQAEGLPTLTSIVVGKGVGAPGAGIPMNQSDMDAQREQVAEGRDPLGRKLDQGLGPRSASGPGASSRTKGASREQERVSFETAPLLRNPMGDVAIPRGWIAIAGPGRLRNAAAHTSSSGSPGCEPWKPAFHPWKVGASRRCQPHFVVSKLAGDRDDGHLPRVDE